LDENPSLDFFAIFAGVGKSCVSMLLARKWWEEFSVAIVEFDIHAGWQL
jgi:predicted GTPase